MPLKGQLLKLPKAVFRKSAASDDGGASIAPGIFATSHKAKQKFWQQQADNMQELARSANFKKNYQSRLRTMKKDLKLARSELRSIKDQLSAVFSNVEEEPHRQMDAENENIDGVSNPANGLEETLAELENGENKLVHDPYFRIGQLHADLAIVTSHRDELQHDLNSSRGALSDVYEEFLKIQHELENDRG